VIWIGEAGHDFGMQDAEEERGHGDDEADERAGGADVKERSARADRRANHDEGAESADQRWKRNEIGIGGMDVVMAAGEVMAKFVDEEDGEERQRERQATDQCEWMFVEQRECVQKFIEVDGFIFSVSCREVRAGDEASAECDEEKQNREQKSFQRWVRGDCGVMRRSRDVRRNRVPFELGLVDGNVGGWDGVVHWGHGAISARCQYSISLGRVQRREIADAIVGRVMLTLKHVVGC
jgi:hypothetical protein